MTIRQTKKLLVTLNVIVTVSAVGIIILNCLCGKSIFTKKMPFTNEEAYDMLAIFFKCFENAVIASREYALRYPFRVHYSREVFQRLSRRLRQTGQVQPVPSVRRHRRVRTEDNIINVLAFDFPGLLENALLETRRNMWLQHDGCPAHYSRIVQDFMNQQFPTRWIGRGSLFPWPPRSPDLTCMDFYLWGRINNLVYKTQLTTREDMIGRIENAVNSISRAKIEATVFSIRSQLIHCIQNDGRQFEQ